MSGMTKQEDIDWKDTNVGALGSEEDKALRKKVAATEPAWADAGKEAGFQVWRIEQFHVVKSDEGHEGKFHKGDSYIVLKTEKGEGDVLIHSIFFFIGSESTQDEYGTAAYKTVELDDYFDGEPSQHREAMGEESDAFKAIFGGEIEYLDGGCPTGFKHVVTNEHKHKTKLFVVRQVKTKVEVLEVPLHTKFLNNNDAFVLDGPKKVYCFEGRDCSAKEKFEANARAEKLEAQRDGHAEATHDIDDDFWAELDGSKPPWAAELEAATKKVESPKAATPKAEAAAAPAKPSAGGTFSLDQLREGCPDGVDASAKELALSDAEFQTVFGMNKEKFVGQPKWKQQAAKKDKGLF